MSRNHYEGRSRSDITSDVDRQEQDYEGHIGELTKIEEDRDIERQTISDMEGLGTIDGMAAVMSPLHEAEQTTEHQCVEEGDALGESQREGEELESDLQEREAGVTRDMERIDEAAQKMHSGESRGFLEQAKTEEQEDITFLHAQDEQAREAREASEQEYERIRQSILGSGG